MKRHVKRFLYIICYLFLVFVFIAFLAGLKAEAYYAPVAFIVPAFIMFFVNRSGYSMQRYEEQSFTTERNQNYHNDKNKIRKHLPNSKKCREISNALIEEAKKSVNLAYTAPTMDAFIEYSNNARQLLEQALVYEKKAGYDYIGSPSYLLNYYNNEFQQKKCRKLSDPLIIEAKKYVNLTYTASTISSYIEYGEKAKSLLKEATVYEKEAGYDLIDRPSYMLDYFDNEYQWKLRDAIEREEVYLISEIKGRQHNNKRACCQGFLDEIESFKEYYSDETLKYAQDAYYRVCAVAGLSAWENTQTGIDTIMDSVDMMDGHEFEYYCAEILSKNGFQNVKVTKGSGDQGVDVLAEKENIKYAIQCKCYSSDIGNKPVQEAFTGKSIYNCQVAAVLTNRYFTQGAVDAAKATGVLLWDRNKLRSFIKNTQSA